ncbi:MAG: beta-glucanosyltransferase [Caeruleum heppii]|nr:MAG: beta-glucanosyltransferase [Caeruleum heppii]
MKGLGALLSTTVALSASTAFAASVQLGKRATTPISVKGNAFYAGDERFYIRGVDYQPGGSSDVKDPIGDPAVCKRDIEKFKELGLNAIRIYSVDNTVNHDECMTALADAGIYLILDVNTPKYSLNRANPARSYNDVYLQHIFATIDAFANYDNTLAFFSGNEVINDGETTNCAPFVKAVTRDMRQYIGSRGYRKIPVGYSAADVEENRKEMAAYMNCGTEDERSDFFAFNDYSWCDPSDFTTSGWDQKIEYFADYSIPLFLSEYGCNTNTREFKEVASLYSTDTSAVYSGGLVYEYTEEPSNYGLVEINGDSVTELDDFRTLQAAFAAQQNPQGDGGAKTDGTPSQCPPQSDTWDVDSDALPAIPENAKRYMTEGAGPGQGGLDGAGSQEAGEASSGTATAGSGAVTAVASGAAASGTKKAAAGALHAPESSFSVFVCGLVVVASSLFGATLL